MCRLSMELRPAGRHNRLGGDLDYFYFLALSKLHGYGIRQKKINQYYEWH